MNGKTDKFPSMGYFKTGIVYNSTIFPYWKIDIFSCDAYVHVCFCMCVCVLFVWLVCVCVSVRVSMLVWVWYMHVFMWLHVCAYVGVCVYMHVFCAEIHAAVVP